MTLTHKPYTRIGVSEKQRENLKLSNRRNGASHSEYKESVNPKKIALAKSKAATRPNRLALGGFLNSRPDLKCRKRFARYGWDVRRNKMSDVLVMQLAIIGLSESADKETRHLACREFFARCDDSARITRRQGFTHYKPARYTHDVFFALGKVEKTRFGAGLSREGKIRAATRALCATATHGDTRDKGSLFYATQEILDRVEGCPETICKDTHFSLSCQSRERAIEAMEELKMSGENGNEKTNGRQKKRKGKLVVFEPSSDVQLITPSHVRMPSDIAKEFAQEQASDDHKMELEDLGYEAGDGSVLSVLIRKCGIRGMTDDKSLALFIEQIEPKGSNVQQNTLINIEAGKADDEYIRGKLREILSR